MIQRRGSLRFTLKAPPRGNVCQSFRKKLDRNRPGELRVKGAVDHAHPTLANQRFDAVLADLGADAYRRELYRRTVSQNWPIQRRALLLKERLDFAANRSLGRTQKRL